MRSRISSSASRSPWCCSDKGWIRAAKGHLDEKAAAELKYKEGDGPRFALHAQSTDKVLMFGTNGRFYTLGCDRLPSARGHGEPVRLMIELGNEQDIVQLEVLKGGRKFLVASDAGRGFVVPEDEVVAQTKNGKQVLNLADKEKAQAFAVVPENADSIAALSDGRKLLIFPLEQVPEMGRGRGVLLQKSKADRLSDAQAFRLADGLPWANRSSRPASSSSGAASAPRPGACPKKAGRAPSASRTDRMDLALIWKTVLIGLVEGITEFLPVSSTGHIILAEEVLHFEGPPGKVFEIVIQLGAILAVCVLYRAKIFAP